MVVVERRCDVGLGGMRLSRATPSLRQHRRAQVNRYLDAAILEQSGRIMSSLTASGTRCCDIVLALCIVTPKSLCWDTLHNLEQNA